MTVFLGAINSERFRLIKSASLFSPTPELHGWTPTSACKTAPGDENGWCGKCLNLCPSLYCSNGQHPLQIVASLSFSSFTLLSTSCHTSKTKHRKTHPTPWPRTSARFAHAVSQSLPLASWSWLGRRHVESRGEPIEHMVFSGWGRPDLKAKSLKEDGTKNSSPQPLLKEISIVSLHLQLDLGIPDSSIFFHAWHFSIGGARLSNPKPAENQTIKTSTKTHAMKKKLPNMRFFSYFVLRAFSSSCFNKAMRFAKSCASSSASEPVEAIKFGKSSTHGHKRVILFFPSFSMFTGGLNTKWASRPFKEDGKASGLSIPTRFLASLAAVKFAWPWDVGCILFGNSPETMGFWMNELQFKKKKHVT